MELYTNQLQTVDFNITRHQKSKKYYKCEDIFTFDVENNNAWIDENGNVIGYEKGKSEEYWNSLECLAIVYIWQFSFNDTVYYGRDLIDFLQVLEDMPKDAKCKIYVHNLGHEFMFLQNILTVKNVFARAPHKPIKCTFKEYPNIEFCCSYMLTNLSLENWGKQLNCEKLVGFLDYDKLYTPLSLLDENALKYAEQDCIVVYQGIKKEQEQYGSLFDIPSTSTGKIRKVCKELLYSTPGYNKYIKRLVPTYEELVNLNKCFCGGYTHCNRLWANQTIDADLFDSIISHWDFTSSYPTVLLTEKYPVGKWVKRTEKWLPKTLNDNYAFIYHLKIYNVKNSNPNSYLQYSKCNVYGSFVNDNGRIKDCNGIVEITCTDVDFEIIKMVYTWDRIELVESWYCKKSYLPSVFLNYILTLYKDKTELKGVIGQEDFYMQQKAYLNSLY